MKSSVIAFVVFVAALLQVSSVVAQERPKTIRIGVASVGTGGRPVTGWSFVSVLADNGSIEKEFSPEGIDVKWTYFSGAGPAVNEAIANDQLDFAFEGDLPSLVARGGGLRTKIVLAVSRFDPIYVSVPSDSGAKTLEDLKGKRIAVFKGTNLQLAFWKVLASKGFKDSDFKIINMSVLDSNAALLAKDIDAQVSGPDVFPLVDRGVAKVIFSTQGDALAGRLTHLLVTEQFEAQYPKVVQRVVNAALKDAAWLANEGNRGRAYQIWTKSGYGLSAWKGDWDAFSLKDRASPLFDEFYRAQYRRLLKAGRDLKLIRKDFDTDQWIDAKYLSQGLKDLKLEGVWRQFTPDGKPKDR